MSSEAQPRSCGDCTLFDKNRVSGEAFGSIKSGDAEMVIGVCRAPLGLLLQARVEESKCVKPSSFSPNKEPVATQDNAAPAEKIVFQSSEHASAT